MVNRIRNYKGEAAIVAGNVVEAGAADGGVIVGTAAAVTIKGVSYGNLSADDITDGRDEIGVTVEGYVKVVISEAVADGDYLQAATGGKVAVYSDTATYVQNERNAIIGRADTSGAADGDVITMKLML